VVCGRQPAVTLRHGTRRYLRSECCFGGSGRSIATPLVKLSLVPILAEHDAGQARKERTVFQFFCVTRLGL